MPGKIEALKAVVAELFANAKEKGEIENLAKVNTAIEDVETENKELTDKNAELIQSYKELIKHTSFREAPKQTETQPTHEKPDLDAFLKTYLAEHKES